MDSATLFKVYSGEQSGGELPFFIGGQYGSGWLRTLGRFAFPILKKVARVAGNTLQDVLVQEKPLLTSLKDNASAEVVNTLANPSTLLPPSSINRSSKQTSSIKKKRKAKSQHLPFFDKRQKKK